MPRLTYIGQTPAEGTGSPVIVLRHLRRLAQHGWQITIIGERGDDTAACDRAGWPVKYLPLRRAWWPPFRADRSILRRIRTTLLARECRRLTAAQPPDAILGYLAAHADFSPEIAAHFARQTGKPLTLLIHDDAAAFARDPAEQRRLHVRHAWILRQAHRCWFVSPELADTYDVPVEHRRVLLPTPEGTFAAPIPTNAHDSVSPKIYYAGHIWPAQYPLLAKIARTLQSAGARLVLQTRETPELRSFLAAEPADWVKPFPGNREALAHLAAHASALLISYTDTTAEMPWIATSFPSKFVEYAHLNVPCAIVAPPDSCIGRWATRNSFPDAFAPAALDAFARWVVSLRDAEHRTACITRMRELAGDAFSPERIQTTFEQNLIR